MSSYYNKGNNNRSNPQTQITSDSIPKGGIKGQVLRKKSSSDYDVEWTTEEPRTLVENKYMTKTYESASLSGISREEAIALSIVL